MFGIQTILICLTQFGKQQAGRMTKTANRDQLDEIEIGGWAILLEPRFLPTITKL